MTTLPTELLAELTDHVDRLVAAGFDEPASISEGAVEMFEDQADADDLRPAAERLTVQAVAAHLCEQETWPDLTDCDRLDAAFADLEADGIVARHNFTCCGTCGHAEIGDEIAQAEEAGAAVRGYTFYHMQDTDRAVDGGGVWLKYGATDGGDRAAEVVAAEVLDALLGHGLAATWDGTASQCVFVPLDWKRRRPAVIMAR